MAARRSRWQAFAGLALLALAGCDPVGRGVVVEPVPEPQLRKVQHPTRPVHWFPRALGPAASGDFHCLAIADFDGDGLPDLAAGGFDQRGIRVWLANGDGTWSAVEGPRHLGRPTSIAVGNVDNDPQGRPDIVVAGKAELPGIRVYRNVLDAKAQKATPGGWETAPPVTITQSYLSVFLRDINKDGRLDIVAAREKNGGQGGIGVWFNRGEQGWSSDVGPKASESYNDVAAADFNGDGHLDLVAARWGNPGGLDIWYGNSRGSWTRAGEDPEIKLNYQGLDTGDFNGNGETDIVATSYRSDIGVCIFLNDRHPNDREPADREAGWWSTPVRLADKGSFWDARAVDLNGDGLLDVVATSFDGRGVRCWLQLPPEVEEGEPRPFVPRFQEQSWPFPHKGTYFAVDAADFNEDGRADVVGVTRDEGVKVWFQTAEANGRIAVSPRARSVPVETWRPRAFGEEDEAPQEPKENYVFRTSVSEAGREYAEYRIGARDLLQVVIYPSRHAEPIEETRRVEPSGELLLPVVSSTPLPIVDKDGYGLTPSQLRGQIKGKLARQVFKDPAVAVTVEKFAAHTASVLGEIRIKPNQSLTGPGQYVLRGRTRVLEFIARHGGFTGNADLTKVEVRKEDGKKRVVNLFKAVFQSKLSQDVILDRGDTVYIPSVRMSDRKVFVLGEVGDPGVYRLEDPITLVEGIQLAGSFLPSANRKQVIVIRGDRQNPTFFQINMLDILRKGDLSKNILLENADIVFVPRNWVANLREFYAWFLPSYDLVSGNR